jgi:hypothetical protein
MAVRTLPRTPQGEGRQQQNEEHSWIQLGHAVVRGWGRFRPGVLEHNERTIDRLGLYATVVVNTLGFLIHGFWAGLRSYIFEVWAAPAALKTIPTGGGRSPPPSGMVLGAAGAAQTPPKRRFHTLVSLCEDMHWLRPAGQVYWAP